MCKTFKISMIIMLIVVFFLPVFSHAKFLTVPKEINDAVKRKCYADWPDNHKKNDRCKIKQKEAWRRIRKRLESNNPKALNCKSEWEPDFVMVEYCINK